MESHQRSWPRGVTIFLLSVVLIGLIVGLVSGWRDGERFQASDYTDAIAVFQIQWMVALFGLLPVSVFLIRLFKERRHFLSTIRTWLPLRAAVYLSFAALATNSVAYGCGLVGDSGFLMRSFFYSSYMFWAGLWVLLCTGLPGLFAQARHGALHALDVVLADTIVALLLLEGGLQIWASHSRSPLFWDVASIESTLKQYRPKPFFPYFNFTFNSQGYHDREFFIARPNDFVVALLADSFGMGVVPYDYNFATVAERTLQKRLSDKFNRVAIHNFGIPCIGMQEYAHLLTTEVLQYRPNLVLLCVFVGNDIEERSGLRTGRRCFQGWLIWTVANRIITLLKEGNPEIGGVTGKEGPGKTDTPLPAYLFDSSLEPPSFSEKAFLRIEKTRLEICNPYNPATARKFEEFFKALQYIENLVKERLMVLLIPDQFQVNDALYDRLLQTKERAKHYIRTYPQERITAYCRAHRIPVLDLTQTLVLAEEKERTYHLRDTHWNTYGNRLAGEAIGSFILHQWQEKRANGGP